MDRVNAKVTLSTLSLKWGDVLSGFLPGAVALFALMPYFSLLSDWMQKLDKIGPGLALVIVAVLSGGVLEAITRIAWEKFLVWRCKPPDSLSNLNQENIDLYERGVQGSYKYVTFYANFAWAIALVLLSRVQQRPAAALSISNAILALTIPILLRASYVQWTYYVNYQKKLFERSKLC